MVPNTCMSVSAHTDHVKCNAELTFCCPRGIISSCYLHNIKHLFIYVYGVKNYLRTMGGVV